MHKIKKHFIINICRVFNILLLLAVLTGGSSFQPGKASFCITLKSEVQKIKADGFNITEVEDHTGLSNIGHITTANNSSQPLSLKGGTALAIKKYLNESFLQPTNGKSIRISIKKLYVDETISANKTVEGNLTIEFGFDLVTGEDLYVHLTDHRGMIKYNRSQDQTGLIDRYVCNGIQNSIRFFSEWLDKHKNNDAALANSVRLVFEDHLEETEGDTIYYSKKRPLKWADFQDRSHYGNYSAEVMPGLGFTESNVVRNGTLIATIHMRVYLPKSAAYVKTGEENEYNLDHEQRHFDIVKIISERFRKKLLNETLPVQNYDGYINVAYFDALREIDAMQKQYDLETNHGSNLPQQLKWNRIIDTELAGYLSGS